MARYGFVVDISRRDAIARMPVSLMLPSCSNIANVRVQFIARAWETREIAPPCDRCAFALFARSKCAAHAIGQYRAIVEIVWRK